MAEEHSLVGDFTSEWRKRPIDLWKVITSFVSQISIGQELTRVSLPSEICHPFSILELIGLREMSFFPVLFDINKHPDNPEERFLSVVRWLCSLLQAEQMEKKPFNPVIGEIHTCWLEHGEGNWSEFLAEQVSHHPPLSAFFVRNKKENITLHSNLQFSVHFGGNNATVQTSGPVSLHTAFEDYTMSKMAPNMIIQRVIYGVKYFMWEGEFSVECKKTGFSATLFAHEEDENTNRLTGKIYLHDKLLYELNGVCGGSTHIWAPGEENKKRELTNGHCIIPEIHYGPKETRVNMDSLKLWRPVAQAIIDADMPRADEEKKVIEQAQRVRERRREAAGEDYNAQFFTAQKDDEGKIVSWVFNTNLSVDPAFLDKMKKQAMQEEEERIKEAEAAAQIIEVESKPEGENCVIN